jgi:uncharacterized membrane protein
MDRKDRKLVRAIIVINIIVVMISIFLWVKYANDVGILITVMSIWTSYFVIRIMANRYGVTEYRFAANQLVDRLLKKLVKW